MLQLNNLRPTQSCQTLLPTQIAFCEFTKPNDDWLFCIIFVWSIKDAIDHFYWTRCRNPGYIFHELARKFSIKYSFELLLHSVQRLMFYLSQAETGMDKFLYGNVLLVNIWGCDFNKWVSDRKWGQIAHQKEINFFLFLDVSWNEANITCLIG